MFLRGYHPDVQAGLGLGAFLLIMASLFTLWTAPNKPKSLVYGFFREAVKIQMAWKTMGWETLESKHFIARFREEDRGVAPLVLAVAEEDYSPIAGAFSYRRQEKIPVIIYPDKEELGRSFGWDSDESAMGVYWAGVIRILSPRAWVEEEADLEKIFRNTGPMAHEFTHLVVDYKTGGNYPRWLTEGIAQLKEYELTGFEFAPNDENDLQQDLYSFSEMDSKYDSLPNQSLAYRQSLAAVQYIYDYYGEKEIYSLLDRLAEGKTLNQAFQSTLGINLTQFEKDFTSWVKINGVH